MYGTRDAATNWEQHYSEKLAEHGFRPGLSSPCVMYHEEKSIRLVVHGDDFTFLGTDDALDWVISLMRMLFDIKIRGRLGPHPTDDKEIRLLNRIISWTTKGLEWEADQRHAEILIRELGLADAQNVVTPGVKTKTDADNDEPLSPAHDSRYRQLVARANFLSIDRPDLHFAVKELARDMPKPTMASWTALTRLGNITWDDRAWRYYSITPNGRQA